jgi:hypothetical protein
VPESLKTIEVLTLFVADPQVSKVFYARTFEPEQLFEDGNSVVLRFDNFVPDLLQRGAPVAWGRRTASFADPDGYLWEVAAPSPG